MSTRTSSPLERSAPADVPPLAAWLRTAAQHAPGAPALLTDQETVSYADLLARVTDLAAALRRAGLRGGDRVAIAATRTPATIVAILACIEAGVGYVPLDAGYPAERLRAMLETSRPRVVIGEPAALATLREAVGELPTLEAPAPPVDLPGAEADLLYVLFTSGSTGVPKGVAMGAMPLRHLIAWHARHPRLGRPARTLQFAPLSFDVHCQEILSSVACGGTLVLLDESQRRDPLQLLAAVQRHRIERLFLPYVALQMLAEAARETPPASLREVVSAGEQLQVSPAIRSLFQRLPEAELHNHYGPTESHVVTAHELRGDAAAWPEIPPIGLPLPHVQIALTEVSTADGVDTGGLLLGGDTLAHGYLGRADLTAERFRPDPQQAGQRWYVTGDLVRRAADGTLTYLGRADDQVKVDGFRIEPGDIELALMAHPGVREAVVTAPELPGAGRQLVAHLVLREPMAEPAAAMRQHLRGRLPDYMVPVRYVVLERLPTTPSGKIDRRGLPLPAVEARRTSTDPAQLLHDLWAELLGVERIDPGQNLFDIGARSLLVLRFVARLRESGVHQLSVTDVYDRPTLRGLAARLRGERRPAAAAAARSGARTAGIAIVGMAARVGSARNVDELWRQLLEGHESIRRLKPEELDDAVPQALRERPNFVAARGVLEDAARFDAEFFGVPPREAVLVDPQQRLLLELCWTALEHAGIDPARREGRVGVYAGTANNSYIAALREEDPELIARAGEFNAMLASEKDYVATRVAHRLDLDGPAVSVHTACSTGLVAVAQAWHALATGQCDVALAGGATVIVPQHGGYLHVEGGMESADGRCRPFDAEASGTVFGSGGAVVVLKRLEDALAAGDTVHAVIRGVGLNNDGADKASFTAPSVAGQAAAIGAALEHAQVDPRSIGYVEAHGTGTALGDPIEIAALERAWREHTADRQFAHIGSIKGHVGHTIAAAGVLGLIKATLSLREQVIPGTLHFKAPNPQIDFAASPFVPLGAPLAWPRGTAPRRAAVSSFGVGGTNAHVIVEEAPPARPREAEARASSAPQGRWILPLSARSPESALQRARDLAAHLERQPTVALHEVAATLMRGRQPMAHRLAVTAASVAEAVQALRAASTPTRAASSPRVVFLFPGQGSQHPGMVGDLYHEVPAFRAALDDCFAALRELGSAADWHAWLVQAAPGDAAAAEALAETRHAQPALFSVSYALAAWLESLGVTPEASIGHSVGEYAAACRAGVMTLHDALAAVLARGEAMFVQPRGGMAAVRAAADVVAASLPPGVEIAGLNAPGLTVVAGPAPALASFCAALEQRGIGTTPLKVSHAFHSAAMEGALPAVERALASRSLAAPSHRVYSCVSGAPLGAAEATDPAYWARQVRAPVRFSAAVQAELERGDAVFIEVGPSQALSALLRQHRDAAGQVPRVVPLLGPAHTPGQPAEQALRGVAAAWCAGVNVQWPVPNGTPRAELPTYPFAGAEHWFRRRARSAPAPTATLPSNLLPAQVPTPMSRIPNIESELTRLLSDVSGLAAADLASGATFVDLGLDSLSLTQATLEIERVFGVKLRFRRLLEDLDTLGKLAGQLDLDMPADRFAPPPPAPVAPAAALLPAATAAPMATAAPAALPMPMPVLPADGLQALVQQQLQLMAQQLALLGGATAANAGVPAVAVAAAAPVAAAPAPQPTVAAAPAAPAAPATSATASQPTIRALVEKPFGASARITLDKRDDLTPAQARWLSEFITRYNARTGKSKSFSQQHRKLMADPRVVTGFNPQWKDLVYPIVVDRSKGAKLWDLDGNEYIDLLSCFGANLLGYQPQALVDAMVAQLEAGIEVGPQHPMSAEVAALISEFTGMERVAFCNTGSEAVMGAMRIARTVTGRKTIAIFTNSYHGIFDEVIVRGTKQLRSLSAAPGILANAVENILVLDWNSEESLRVLRERGPELAAIMTEPIQNKYPTVQPHDFVKALRRIADDAGCALIFDEVVTGFRVAPGGAQEWYGVRADIATYGKIIGGGLPFAAIGGGSRWLDALDGGHWQYGDDSYPEAGVTYFAGTFVRHPLALAAARASLLHLKRGGRELYRSLNERTERFIQRLNTAFVLRGAPVKAVHCASLWRLAWDEDQKHVSLFYYLVRFHGLHLYEQFGHFVTEAMGEPELDRIFTVFTEALDELMALGLITPRPGGSGGGLPAPSAAPASGALGPGQTERWLLGSFDTHARRALNESLCVTLKGDVDLGALRGALARVLQRHEAFRLRFDLDQPQQTVDPAAETPIAELDLRDQADADAALDAFCAQASERDFPLDRAPLAAATLLQLSDGRVVVHLVASHLVFDGWASSVFNAELAHAYTALCAGREPALPPAESPLAFARQEVARFAGTEGQAALQYWQGVLRSPPPPLALGDRQPPEPRRFVADTVRARIEGRGLAQLRADAKAAGATLFQWLLAGVARLLRERGGQDEFVVCVPYAAQSLMRHGPLLGDGVLDLPLRLRVPAQASTRDLLPQVRNALMDAMEHPLMTQGTAARALGLRAEGSKPPLTGVFFNLNPKVDLSGWSPLVATMHEGRKRGLLSELFFNFYEQGEAITLDLHHSAEHFSPARAQSLVDELVALLAPAAAERPALDPRLLAWNATDRPLTPVAGSLRVEAWVSHQAGATPAATAVVAADGQLSYAALESRANRMAQWLHARGIGPGARVGINLSRGVDLVPAMLAVLKTGAAYVPLDPGFPAERLRMMAEDAALPLVITTSAHAGTSGLPRAAQLRLDDDAALLAQAPDTPLPAAQGDGAAAYVIYTSGSTGKPKGVAVPQRAVCNFLASMSRQPGLAAGERLLAVTTLSFDIAVLELLLPLVNGGTVVLAQREDAMDGQALAELIARHHIDLMQATPTTWHLLLDAGWRAPNGFRALCGGEPLPPGLAAALLRAGVTLWNLYGPTETTVWSALARVDDPQAKITIGRPIDNTQVWIVDEALKPLPVGAEGEICIGGDGVALGYHERPELTAERFVVLPFGPRAGQRAYRTGDLGRWREDGTLEHLGRLDFQVKIRGYRIELGEIESRLEQAAGVARAVVVARDVTPGDTALVGYVVPRAGAAVDTGELRDALRRTLPDYMVPRSLLTLASLPLLPNGKVDRKALPAPAPGPAPVAASTPAVAAPAPAAANDDAADSVLQTIAREMGLLLGRGPLGADEHFFEQGGHSLMAAKLSATLAAALGHRPGLRAIFESPTPARLARALRQAMAGAAAAPQARAADLIPVRADQRRAPLSQMQQRVWFLENLNPGTVVYGMPAAHTLKGPLDVQAFDRAWQLLVARQGVMRTVIERTPTGDVQRVLDELPCSLLPLEDLTHLPEAQRHAAMHATIAQLVKQPFDLEQGPLFTTRLFRIGPQEHTLFFQAHHLIWDAWSFDLLYSDLAELYAACLEQRAPQLPAMSVSYGDFAAWHNEWMSGAELKRQTAFWREKLTPLPPPIELPLDRARPAAMSGRGDSVRFNLPREVSEPLRAQAQRHGRTLYVTLLAAFALALQRTARQNDFVIGTPVRGREQPALEPLMGFFVNMLPLRMRFGPDMTMPEWLANVHAQVVDSFSSPDVPFDHLVRELGVPRDGSRPAIHQVSFSYQDVRGRQTRWGNVDHERTATPIVGAAQDLSLWCVETNEHTEFVFTFNADILEAASVQRFALRLEALLQQIVADPDKRLQDYRFATPQEQAALASWNRTEAPLDRTATVPSLLEAQRARTPEAIAASQAGEGSSTYAELHGRANRLARLLRSRGMGRGKLVGLALERGLDQLVAQLAILKSGAAYVPLDPAYPADRLAYMAQDARLALLVGASNTLGALEWPRDRTLMVDIDAAAIEAESEAPLAPDAERDATAADAAYVIYTSGSTGKPKGVVVPHGTVVNFLQSMAREPGLTAQDRLLAVTTLSFDIAVLELLLPLVVGAEVVLSRRDDVLDPRALAALLEDGVTCMQATPSTWRSLVESGWAGKPGFKALIGGEPLPVDLAEALLERCGELWNMYGPTETTVWSTCWKVTTPRVGISIGRPIANTQVHILDTEGKPCPVGVAGEIHIGGDGVAVGYLYRPELTAERFVADPFAQRAGARLYRTGDLGRWTEQGLLEHLGRLDFQVKVRGHRIELGEIEAALAAVPGVAQAVVQAREDRPGDVRLVAYLTVRDAAPAPETLRQHLRGTLPDYMVPQHFVTLAAIPLLPNGKIDRQSLPKPADTAGMQAANDGLVAPRTEAERQIAAVWQQLLSIERVGVNDNFFDLGGHSLLAMRAVTEIKNRLGVTLSVRRLIFETLGQLAASAGPAAAADPAPQAAAAQTAPAAPRGWLDRLFGRRAT